MRAVGYRPQRAEVGKRRVHDFSAAARETLLNFEEARSPSPLNDSAHHRARAGSRVSATAGDRTPIDDRIRPRGGTNPNAEAWYYFRLIGRARARGADAEHKRQP